MMEERIVEKVIEAWRKKDFHVLTDWLVSLGGEVLHDGEGDCTVKGSSGITCGFMNSDPITLATLAGFAIAGALWPVVFPSLLKKVKEEWKYWLKLMEEINNEIGE